MIRAPTTRWVAIAGVAMLIAIAADSLVPVSRQLGLHWLIEHFLAYFAVTIIFSLALQRPFIVAGVVMALAGLMEALQGLTPDRIPDLPTALSGAAGALAGALMVTLLSGLPKRQQAAHGAVPPVAQPPQM